MRLSKTNILANARTTSASVQKSVAVTKDKVIENPSALIVISILAALLIAPAVSTAVDNTNTEVVSETESSVETSEESYEEHGEATVIVDGEEYTSEDGEIDVKLENANEVHIDGGNSESISTKVTITSSSSGDESDEGAGLSLNGEEVEQSRTGRFREEIETEHSETDIRGRVEGNAEINIEVR